MDTALHQKLVSFIWSIADDCLRDIYVRGKYRDVILPMVVLRRLDAMLEPTKTKVIEELKYQTTEKMPSLDGAEFKRITGYVFYNTSPWTLQSLHSTAVNSTQQLAQNVVDYLNGFSDNVKEIVAKFKLFEQVQHMADKNILLDVIGKFTSPYINLSPLEKIDPQGHRLPGLSNLGMGYVFEELIRKFNEENNEEAGEHFTPREVIDLMTHIVIEPVKDRIESIMQVYDPACGSGGMLTEAQQFINDPEGLIRAVNTDVYLFGKEINDETYAICKSDMMIKGKNPEHIRVGSTLATDEFAGQTFDFMLSNPPYGKSWAGEMKYIKDKKEVIDKRFQVELADYFGNRNIEDAIPRSSDGQLLFLMEMVTKMKASGSRIASVHNGSSLFTGDAGSGESNIRRHIIENDWLECIVQLPNNMFYNTGITTYIWILSNHKHPARKGKVQLIDASRQFAKLRKNLGNKNCELRPEHIRHIYDTYLSMAECNDNSDQGIASKVFLNSDLGYNKVTIERPKRLKAVFNDENIENLRYDKSQLGQIMQWAYGEYGDTLYTNFAAHIGSILAWAEENDMDLNIKQKKILSDAEFWKKKHQLLQTAKQVAAIVGTDEHFDFNLFRKQVDKALKQIDAKLSASEKNTLLDVVSSYDERAEKVQKTLHKFTANQLNDLTAHLSCSEDQLPDYGYYPSGKTGEYIEYETESDLRDYENIPLAQNVHAYFVREVKPYVSEAWINLDATKIGYEISFNKYFYQPKPLRSLDEVTADILQLDAESDGLIRSILSLTDQNPSAL